MSTEKLVYIYCVGVCQPFYMGNLIGWHSWCRVTFMMWTCNTCHYAGSQGTTSSSIASSGVDAIELPEYFEEMFHVHC